jgi:hypothetical protein
MHFLPYPWIIGWLISSIGWGITLAALRKSQAIVKDMAPWIIIKQQQDNQDKFLASLAPNEQQAVSQIEMEDLQAKYRK